MLENYSFGIPAGCSGKGDRLFFEGSEKKFELVTSAGSPSFRLLPPLYWERLVAQAGGAIITRLSNNLCDSYILSESSLLVYDHKVIMITCGRTTLIDAALDILRQVQPDQVELFFYERKNELFPHQQQSTFSEDARVLSAVLPGRDCLFGEHGGHRHHLHLFHLDRPYTPPAGDTTLEILMYGISLKSREIFCRGVNHEKSYIRDHTGVHQILPDFEIADHVFQPAGYSLNAIRNADYYTLHVTPQEVGSYVSFETNCCTQVSQSELIQRILMIFQPEDFDLIVFGALDKNLQVDPTYELTLQIADTLSCGYNVHYRNYCQRRNEIQAIGF